MEPIEEIKAKLDIVTFIMPYVPLKQAGRNFKGLCPFHGEKTPSFFVSPERQTWHCFGCNKGGDVISFYEQIENLEFYEALKSLAERTGVVLKYQEPEKTKQKHDLYSINELTAKFYHYLLMEHAVGKEALRYAKEERKLLPKTIESFQLGYAPDKWDSLLKFLKKHKVEERQAYTAGVLSKSAKGYFDMFRGRLMFPLHDHRGNIIGFAGRVLDKEAKTAKYINTPETPIYIKGNTLFGLYQNADAIKEAHMVILVEGELDVLSSVQAGVKNVVAVKGTALTTNQLTLLRRYAQTLVLALDQDSAGQTATRRSIELAIEAGFTVRIATLPFGKDVDDLAKQSPKAWQRAVETARPYYDWLVESILAKHNLQDPFEKSKASQELLPFLQAIDNEIVREHYYNLVAQKLGTTTQTLFRMQRRMKSPQARASAKTQADEGTKKPKEVALLAYILAIVLQSEKPQLYLDNLVTTIENESIPVSAERQLWELLLSEWLTKQEKFSQKDFLAKLPKPLEPLVDTLFLAEIDQSIFKEPEATAKELHKATQALRKLLVKTKLKEVMAQMNSEKSNETLAKTFTALQNELKQLST